jgi:hypothetical protein
MQPDAEAAQLFSRFKVDDLPRISDPEQKLYAAFELKRGGLTQVAGPGVWLPGLKSLLSGFAPGVPQGDVFQMPGTFLIHNGKILRAYRHETSADRPDYCELAQTPDSAPDA